MTDKPPPETLSPDQLTERLQTAEHKVRLKMLEQITDVWDNYIDPRDAYLDDDGVTRWLPIGVSGQHGGVRDLIVDEAALGLIRKECRELALINEFAINGHENRISYIVGTGHQYELVAKPDMEVSDKDLAAGQKVLDEFYKEARWHKRQQEIVRRCDRDGEAFLRFFDTPEMVQVRFVEPNEVIRPQKASGDPASTFGVKTNKDDVETVVGYWLGEEFVNADQIQHRKTNVDVNVKRGLPLFYPVRKNLRRAEKLLRNMTVAAEIQAAIAMVRKHTAGETSVQSFVQGTADHERTSPTTGNTAYLRQYAPGSILDTSGGMEYEFPTVGMNAASHVAVLQAELRAIASRLCMPEFMLSSDASNANYSSTMVAEGPSVKLFERLQFDMIVSDKEVLRRVLEHAAGAGRLKAETLAQCEIQVTPPRLETRDRLKETQADAILVANKAMSRHTMASRHGLDPDAEEELIDQEREKADPYGGLEDNPLFDKQKRDEGSDDNG